MFVVMCLVAAQLQVDPPAQRFEITGKRTVALDAAPVVVADDITDLEITRYKTALAPLTPRFHKASTFRGDGPAIYVGEEGRNAAFETRKLRRMLGSLKEPDPRGYRLVVDSAGVALAGRDAQGTSSGLRTLHALLMQTTDLPYLIIRDAPDLPTRGVMITGAPSAEFLDELAALKCNLVVFDSPEFWTLENGEASRWRDMFAHARAVGIEPVPLLAPLSKAQALTARRPNVAEGAEAEERHVLETDFPALLEHPRVIEASDTPIEVTVSGSKTARDKDYAIRRATRGTLRPEEDTRLELWRLPGGAIPDGATVEVRYTYLPPDTRAVCPSAEETWDAMEAVLSRLHEALEPSLIFLDVALPARFNADRRCQSRGKPDAELFLEIVTRFDQLVKRNSAPSAADQPSGARLMLGGDPMLLDLGADTYDFRPALEKLPADAILCFLETDTAASTIQNAVWRRRTLLLAPPALPVPAYEACAALSGETRPAQGVLLSVADPVTEHDTIQLALRKTWRISGVTAPWPGGLNAYFGAKLWRPDSSAMLSAMIRRLNQRAVNGVAPRDERRAFQSAMERLKSAFPLAPELADAETLYGRLISYLELEAAFTERQTSATLTKLTRLVEEHAAFAAKWEPDRKERIVNTIKNQRLFVPSTILFGEYLAPYRPVNIPTGHTLLEAPATPRFSDSEKEAVAEYNLLTPPGPIARVDFDTVGTALFRIEGGADPRETSVLAEVRSSERGGVRAPVMLPKPAAVSFVRLTVHAPAERAVLRAPRLYALKGGAAAGCTSTAAPPRIETAPNVPPWPGAPTVVGFVRDDGDQFAEAPSAVRLMRSGRFLHIGIEAFDPRPDTALATRTQRDTALWEEESFEVHIDTGKGPAYRFIVNPLGAQYDARGGNAAWDGEWQVKTRQTANGWEAVMAIPFAELGASPQSGQPWRMNFVRNRANVRRERSVWAYDPASRKPLTYGAVTFE